MKRNAYLFPLVLLLVACTTMGIPQADTFNKRELVAAKMVTSIRDVAYTLAVAGKIDKKDSQNIQDQADALRTAVEIAGTIYETDPLAAENRLAAAITGLNMLSEYLALREKK